MGKQTVLAKKRRGPLPTGKGVQVVVRLQPDPLRALDGWAAKQNDNPTRAEAIRRLVKLGLTVKTKARPTERTRARASELAAKAIDSLTVGTADAGDQASRKRRLLKGPEEFRELRVDRLKAKGK
jgi:hypothetical protein